ncbi:MAG TPA: rod shape-determining protein MreC [Candidatus Paceibacterota bacterium]|nr:rod shape-determining protein MreC [Candidatus Paceibacterota bacterium]
MANVSYYRSPQSNRRGPQRLFFATILVVVLVCANYITHGSVASAVRAVVAPLETGITRAGETIGGSGFFASKSGLEAQVRDLQAQVNDLQTRSAAFSVLQQQYDSLAQLEHLAQTNPGRAAPITSSVISSPYGTFSIGSGNTDGTQPGAIVLASGDFVVGKVVQAGSDSALVQQIFAPGIQTNVTIDGIAGIASGQGGDARVDLPHGATVAVGDPVIAPELKAHPIGLVARVDTNPANAQTIVYVSFPVSLSSLQFVYVTP